MNIAVTGGASGIGRAVVDILLSHGASFSVADLNVSTFKSSRNTDGATNGLLPTLVGVRKADSVASWLQTTVAKFGRLDGAANIAGTLGNDVGGTALRDMNELDWTTIINVNLNGLVNCMKAELALLTRGGSIVNMASTLGIQPAPLMGAYSTSKVGVICLTKCAAKEESPASIRINAVAPDKVDTPMIAFMKKKRPGSPMIKGVKQSTPLRRLGQAEEVAQTVAFLSDETSSITGAIYKVDGGLGV